MASASITPEAIDLQLAFNVIPGQFMVLDPHLNIQYINDALLHAIFMNRPETIGRHVFEVFPYNPDSPESEGLLFLKDAWEKVLATKQPCSLPTIRYDIRRPEGGFEEKYWTPLSIPLLNATGELVGIVHQATDVTELEKEKKAALRNEELLRVISQNINDVVWDWNLRTNDITWSDGFSNQFGYNAYETGPDINSWYSRIHPDDAERVVDGIHAVIDHPTETRWMDIYRFKTKQGDYVDIIDRGTVLRDEHGQPYRMIGAMVDITIGKKAEQEAREHAARLLSVMESMPQMAWTATPNGEVNYYNQQWPNFIGVSLEELYRKGWGNFMHPDDLVHTVANWRRVLKTGQSFEIEHRYLKAPEMEYRWFLTRGVPVRNDEGDIVLWTGTCTYIDDQKKMAQRLQAQDEKMQRILSQAPAHFCLIKGPEQIIDFATPGIRHLFGDRECIGLPIAVAWPEIEEQGLTRYMREVYETGQPHFFWETLVMVDRQNNGVLTEGYYDFTYQPFRSVEDEVEGVLILAVEVTNQVQAKQAAKKLSEELLQEKERFQFLADSIPQLVWTADPQGYHDYFNQRWIDYTGYDLTASRGTEMWHNLLHPEDRERARKRWAHSLQTGEFYEIEYRFKSQAGDYKWFLGQATPMRNTQGEIIRWFGTCTDIEEQKRWQEDLIRANEELKKANADLDSFVYTASHDLKLPIISMSRIFSELTKSAEFHDPDAGKLIGMFQKSLSQINATIQDLADIVKVQKNAEETKEDVDLQELTGEVMLSIQDMIAEAEARITTDFGRVPEVYFSRVNLKSVIYNLLSNAIKYRAPQRVPEITITSALDNTCVVLTVTDNGLGINLERHREKLFQMFKRFHSHVPGSGIGLYIINRIVKNGGGRIELESEVNQGTTFRIYLPRK